MPSDSNRFGADNPFAQAMTQARTATEDFTRLFSEMKVPSMMPDMEALLSAYRRNMEAMSAANRIALEGAQAVAKRHMEIMQQTMSELSETMRGLATDTPQNKAAHQAELLKRAYERAVANTKELSDLIQHASGEALATLNKRFTESMDEVKLLADKAAIGKHQ